MKVSVKSKKGRLKRLSLVGRKSLGSGEMGRTVVCCDKDGVNDGRKRLKLSKYFNDCNAAGKTAVPRKLRTAMKKRNCESSSSTLTDLKKPTRMIHEDGLPKHNVAEKFKRDVVLNSSPGNSLSGPLTEDEQEVAEVLFGMACMFPDSGASPDANYGHSSLQTDELALSDAMQCSITAEGMKAELDSSVHSLRKAAVSTTAIEGKHGEEIKVVVATEEPMIIRTNLQDKQPSEEPAKKEEPSTRTWFRSERSSCNMGIDSESCINFRLEQSAGATHAFNPGSQKSDGGLASCNGSQLSCPSLMKGVTQNAPPAWSIGLPVVSNGSSNLLETSTSKMPAWNDVTAHPQRLASGGARHSKGAKNTVARIPWKRCATHVHIGYRILELKGRDTKDSAAMQYMHMKLERDANKGLRLQASLQRSRTSGFDGVILANTTETKPEPMFNGFKGSGMPSLEMTPNEKHLQNLHSGFKPERQVYDFLSLSAGESGVDPNTRGSRTRTGSMSKMSSYLSLGQVSTQGAHQVVPTSNNHYTPSHVNQSNAAVLQQVRLQLPTSIGSSGSALPQKGPCVWTKEQQQQQMLWAAMAHRQGLQINIDHATGMQCSLPLVPSFPVAHTPQYTAKPSQQHHQQPAPLPRDLKLFSSSKMPQDRFYAGALPPQLLCSKRR